jgi:adenylylsulfate kinase-like enzyme
VVDHLDNMIYWLTGQPGAGKTTLANNLKDYIPKSIHIDGDDMRELFDNKDYSKKGRMKNIELTQNIAYFMHSKSLNVIVSLVSPYRKQREKFKQLLGDKIKEIYVHTTEIRGREQYHVLDYEQPIRNYIDINTTDTSIQKCIDKIMSQI